MKLNDLDIGVIHDGLEMLVEHYGKMTEEELNSTLSGDRDKYIKCMCRLYNTFQHLVYIDGNVFIEFKDENK